MAVGGHDKQRLGVGPAQALDGALVPCYAAQLLAGETVEIYGRLGRLARLVGLQLSLIRPECWRLPLAMWQRGAVCSRKQVCLPAYLERLRRERRRRYTCPSRGFHRKWTCTAASCETTARQHAPIRPLREAYPCSGSYLIMSPDITMRYPLPRGALPLVDPGSDKADMTVEARSSGELRCHCASLRYGYFTANQPPAARYRHWDGRCSLAIRLPHQSFLIALQQL